MRAGVKMAVKNESSVNFCVLFDEKQIIKPFFCGAVVAAVLVFGVFGSFSRRAFYCNPIRNSTYAEPTPMKTNILPLISLLMLADYLFTFY